jgi:hypothetical protein
LGDLFSGLLFRVTELPGAFLLFLLPKALCLSKKDFAAEMKSSSMLTVSFALVSKNLIPFLSANKKAN